MRLKKKITAKYQASVTKIELWKYSECVIVDFPHFREDNYCHPLCLEGSGKRISLINNF